MVTGALEMEGDAAWEGSKKASLEFLLAQCVALGLSNFNFAPGGTAMDDDDDNEEEKEEDDDDGEDRNSGLSGAVSAVAVAGAVANRQACAVVLRFLASS